MSRRKRIVSQTEAVLSELSSVMQLLSLDEFSQAKLNHINDQLKMNIELQNLDDIESLLTVADQLIAEKANDVLSDIKCKIDFNFQEKAK